MVQNQNGDAQIDIPPEMIQKYLQRRIVDLELLEDHLRTQNAPGIQGIAHQLKGNASSFGFGELSDVAIHLEMSAKASDWKQMTELITRYRTWLDNALKN